MDNDFPKMKMELCTRKNGALNNTLTSREETRGKRGGERGRRKDKRGKKDETRE